MGTENDSAGVKLDSTRLLDSLRSDIERAAAFIWCAERKCEDLGLKKTKKEMSAVYADLVRAGKLITKHIKSNNMVGL